MLGIGALSAGISDSQVCVLDSCTHEVAQHVCTAEMFNTIVPINLAGYKDKRLCNI